MTLDAIRKKDPADMYSAMLNLHEHITEAIDLGKAAKAVSPVKIKRVVILGMGGSAMGGDLLRSYVHSFADHNLVDIVVNRSYKPPTVDKSTLVVVSSYSGATEETLAAYNACFAKAGHVLAVTTGGDVARIARANRHALIIIPSGLQPRAAIAYSFFPLLQLLAINSELFGGEVKRKTEASLPETIAQVKRLGAKYAEGETKSNIAFDTAKILHGKIPVIYSASDRMEAINMRWRTQIQENAKQVAFGNLLPEMNHNEINGFSHPASALKSLACVFMRDTDDHTRVKKRIDFTKKTVTGKVGATYNVNSLGTSLLARMFSLIQQGDWASYYLAALNGVDPSPVPVIQSLKRHLAK